MGDSTQIQTRTGIPAIDELDDREIRNANGTRRMAEKRFVASDRKTGRTKRSTGAAGRAVSKINVVRRGPLYVVVRPESA